MAKPRRKTRKWKIYRRGRRTKLNARKTKCRKGMEWKKSDGWRASKRAKGEGSDVCREETKDKELSKMRYGKEGK